jgi:putative tryptophan/tyrosine transport system substrate-binding protein
MAQEPGRTYRLGVLGRVPPFDSAQNGTIVAMLEALRQRGFIEGKNLTLVVRAFGHHRELMSEYAAELVKAQVDVIYTVGVSTIRAAQQATKTIPILAITDDMVGSGLVPSLAHPNGNTNGVSILATELDGKRQEILIEAVPGLRRMAALADSYTTADDHALQEAARAHGVELSFHRITKPEEIAAAIDAAHALGATALNVLASPILDSNRHVTMDRVAAQRLPTIYQWPEAAEEGGFAAYGPPFLQLWREVLARQLVQLFSGVKPADIPIEQQRHGQSLRSADFTPPEDQPVDLPSSESSETSSEDGRIRLESIKSRDRHSPWSVDQQDGGFIVRDANGHALAYVYFEEEPGPEPPNDWRARPRRSGTKRGLVRGLFDMDQKALVLRSRAAR